MFVDAAIHDPVPGVISAAGLKESQDEADRGPPFGRMRRNKPFKQEPAGG
jgi:hypothetical protein